MDGDLGLHQRWPGEERRVRIRRALLWREATPEQMTKECRDLGVSAALSWLWTQHHLAMRRRPWALDPGDTVIEELLENAKALVEERSNGPVPWVVVERPSS